MDVNLYNKLIRDAVNASNLSARASAQDKNSYCRQLLENIDEHDVIIAILADVVEGILEDKAEDQFATFGVGDGVSVLGNGKSQPATITAVKEDLVVVQIDDIDEHGNFVPNSGAETIVFHRSHDQVFIHYEGRSLRRLKTGKRFSDYSSDRIAEGLKHLSALTSTVETSVAE